MKFENIIALVACIILFLSIIFTIYKKNNIIIKQEPNIEKTEPQPKIEIKPEPEIDINPNFLEYLPIRDVNELGIVLSDIESHLPKNHIYKDSDRITWGHEGVHGINSNLRQRSSIKSFTLANQTTTEVKYMGGLIDDIHGHPVFKSFAGINAFYLLENRYVILNEPNTTISAVSNVVPQSLKGGVYNLYLVNQAKSWNDTPLYLFDEWVAYTSGSLVRLDLNIKERSETVLYMLEFNVYSLCVAMTSKTDDPEIKNFLKWNIKRAMKVYEDSKNKFGVSDAQEQYLQKMINSQDAESFRNFTRNYLGTEWTKNILKF